MRIAWTALILLTAVACDGLNSSQRSIRLDAPSGAESTPAAAKPAADERSLGGIPVAPIRPEFTGEPGPVGSEVECDPVFGSKPGQVWYSFDDRACHDGTSRSMVQLLHSGSDGLGCTVRWFGEVTDVFVNSFAGAGVAATTVDLSEYKKVVLEVRGDGGIYRAETPMKKQIESKELDETGCGSLDWDFYGTEFVCGDGTDSWGEVRVDLEDLHQDGWGNVMELDRTDVANFHLATPRGELGGFQCEFRVIGLER